MLAASWKHWVLTFTFMLLYSTNIRNVADRAKSLPQQETLLHKPAQDQLIKQEPKAQTGFQTPQMGILSSICGMCRNKPDPWTSNTIQDSEGPFPTSQSQTRHKEVHVPWVRAILAKQGRPARYLADGFVASIETGFISRSYIQIMHMLMYY